MFLKEFAIRRYGPLADNGKRILSQFNLFYGPNEEGKTLTIDAILKMLFGKGAARNFEAVRRVDENPDGYLVIEESSKEEVKLPEAGTLPGLFGIGVSEFSNIFVIRDSDLSITDESDFYHGITARLTGMHSAEIGRIKDRLYDLGRITTGGEFQNVTPQKLKDRIKKARLILEKIEPLFFKLQEEGFSLFEEEMARLDQDYRDSTEKLNHFRAAQGRERYLKGQEALKRIQKAVTELGELKSCNQGDYEAWQRAEMSLEHLQEDCLNLEKEIAENKVVLMAAREAKQSKSVAFRKVERELKEAVEKIEPLLTEISSQYNKLLKQETLIKNRYFNRTALTAILILLVSLAGSIIRPSWWLFIFLGLSALITILSGSILLSLLVKRSRLEGLEAQACIKAEELGLPAGDIHEVRAGFGRIKSEAVLVAENLSDAEKEADWQQKELERLSGQFEEKMRRIKEIEENLNRMRQDLATDTLAAFAAKLKRKQKLSNEIDKQRSLLESHFGRQAELTSHEAYISFWTEQVEELSPYASAIPDLKYDQRVVTRLNEVIETLEKESKELQGKMQERFEELRDIEKEVNELFYIDEEGYLPCQTTLDLDKIRQKLEEWIAVQEENKKAALVALEIFAEMEIEEEQKVTALFGHDSPVSNYFNKITGGRYQEVFFESRDNPIKTIRHDGLELEASKLSGGTYDQLYFAIRLALGEKLLESERGFFILDDPFIKADPVRLEALMAMLFEICADGWQILYFSSKGEVKEALQEKITTGEVREFSISQQ